MLLLATSMLALLRPAFSQSNAPLVTPVGPTSQVMFVPQNSVFGNSLRRVPSGPNQQTSPGTPGGIVSYLLASPVGPTPQVNFVPQNSVFGSSLRRVPTGPNRQRSPGTGPGFASSLLQNSVFGSSARLVPSGPNQETSPGTGPGIASSLLASPVGPTPQVNFVPQNSVFGSSLRRVPTGPNRQRSPGTGPPGIANSLLQNSVFGSSARLVPSGPNHQTSPGTGPGIASSLLASDLPMSRVGKCIDANINLIANANFGTITSERNGFWVYSAVPDVSENDDLYWAHLQSQPTTTPNNYLLTVYTQTQNEELQISLRLIVTDIETGYATATILNGNIDGSLSFKIFITDYSPGRYALFYICSDDVDDIGIDYRYIIAHGWPLSNEERAAANQNDRQNGFRGEMVML